MIQYPLGNPHRRYDARQYPPRPPVDLDNPWSPTIPYYFPPRRPFSDH